MRPSSSSNYSSFSPSTSFNPREPLLKRHSYRKDGKSFLYQLAKWAGFVVLVVLLMIIFDKLYTQMQNQPVDPTIPVGILQLGSRKNENDIAEVRIEGASTSYKDLTLDELFRLSQGNTSSSLPLTTLTLKYINFDPEELTQALNAPQFQTLTSIRMERVKISPGKSWNFHRVKLPNLVDFYLDQDIEFHDQYTLYMKEITRETLLEMMFYDKGEKPLTDIAQKLATEGVEVTVRYDGWTVLSFTRNGQDKGQRNLILGIEFSQELVSSLTKQGLDIGHLTMTECNFSIQAFPPRLKYLNLYRVTLTEGSITDYFNSPSSSLLRELYVEMRNASLKLNDIPKTVKVLGLGDVIDGGIQDGDFVPAEGVGLGFPLDPQIIQNFHNLFPKVKRVGVFEPTDGVQHLLLQNILKTNATWVLMEGFERKASSNWTEVEKEMEQVLVACGVSPGERNFLLYKDARTLSWFEMDIDKANKLRFRYQLLGWEEYISWDVFSANF